MLDHLSHRIEQPADATESGPETDLFSFLGQLLPDGRLTQTGDDFLFSAAAPERSSVRQLWAAIFERLEAYPGTRDIAQGPSGVRVTFDPSVSGAARHLEIVVEPFAAHQVAE